MTCIYCGNPGTGGDMCPSCEAREYQREMERQQEAEWYEQQVYELALLQSEINELMVIG